MSFIANLVARNLGQVAAIRPRPAQIFEPVYGSRPLLREPAVAQDTETEMSGLPELSYEPSLHSGPGHRRPRGIAPEADGRSGEFAEPETILHPRETGQSAQRGGPFRNSRRSAATNPDNAIRPTAPDLEYSQPDRPEMSLGPDANLQVSWVARALARSNMEIPLQLAPTAIAEHASRTSPAQDNFPLPPGGEIPVLNTRLAQPGAVASAPTPANGAGLLGSPRRSCLGSERQDTIFVAKPERIAAEPVIEVTIGRIEIRAETTGTSTRKTEPAVSPVMGLEEYLRRKNNRGNA